MITPFDSGTSAVTAFSRKMGVTANNIANVNTDDFKKSRTLLREGETGGVKAEIQEVDTPGYPKVIDNGEEQIEVQSSNVDLTEEITETIPTSVAYKANLKTIQAWDEMLGNLIDTLG